MDKGIKTTIKKIFQTNQIRLVGFSSRPDEFGDLVYTVNGHFMDIYCCDDFEKVLEEIRQQTYMRVVYNVDNNSVLIKR